MTRELPVSQVVRHKTALRRNALSRPIRLAIEDGLISQDTDVLDYGCGHGDDIRRLARQGITCRGWDPRLRPNGTRSPAAVVNLGYVINVIEDTAERRCALQSAWSLARDVLIVAARTTCDAPADPGAKYADGYLTRLDTFQKFFEQHELRAWIDSTLAEHSVPAAPGVFYVFRHCEAREAYLASRWHRRVTAPRIRRSDLLFEQHKELFEELMGFLSTRGRLPRDEELSCASEIREHLGSIRRAFSILRRVTNTDDWEEIRETRSQDILVYLALSRFDKRPRFSDLPRELQLDVRAFFRSYKRVCDLADALLFAAGDRALVSAAMRESPIGKSMPTALYVHVSALPSLAPILRVYEGCARRYIGQVEDANLIKLHRNEPAVSYACYPRFEKEAHPALAWSLHIPLHTFRVRRRDYTESANPPILHRKEVFLSSDHPHRPKFAKLTRAEERRGLYATPATIGTRDGWEEVLANAGITIRGHRVASRSASSRDGGGRRAHPNSDSPKTG